MAEGAGSRAGGRRRAWGLAAALAISATPAAAQFSENYTFLKAVRDADGDKVTKSLSSSGTIVNTRDSNTGETALHIVARRRDLTWLSFLLAKGASVNARDRAGNGALAIAAQLGWVEGAELLIRVGATIDMANASGETPLILAIHDRDLAMARLLLTNGADPRLADHVAGKSARDYAAEDGRAGALLRLIDAQAKPVSKAPMQGPQLPR